MRRIILCCLIVLPVSILYAAALAIDSINLVDGTTKVVDNAYIYETERGNADVQSAHLNLCEQGICVLIGQYEGAMTIYKIKDAVLTSEEWARLHKKANGLTEKQHHDGWVALSGEEFTKQYQAYLRQSLENTVDTYQIKLPPYDRRVYGIKFGQVGGKRKDRNFDFDVRTKRLKLT